MTQPPVRKFLIRAPAHPRTRAPTQPLTHALSYQRRARAAVLGASQVEVTAIHDVNCIAFRSANREQDVSTTDEVAGDWTGDGNVSNGLCWRCGGVRSRTSVRRVGGLVPRQYGTGGVVRLMGISKRGDAQLATLHGSLDRQQRAS